MERSSYIEVISGECFLSHYNPLLYSDSMVLWTNQTELDDLSSGSSITIDNLKPALNVIKKWEDDLMDPETEDNQEYVEYVRMKIRHSINPIN